MSNYPARFHSARSRLSAAVAGAIAAWVLALGPGLAPAVAKHLDGVTDMLQARNADCDAGKKERAIRFSRSKL